MNFLDKLERKIGRYAIPNLSLYLILGYVLGYVLEFINSNIVYFLSLNPYLILHGQIWRLVTWVIIPPSDFSFWTIIMLFFYYSVGTSLERTWGTFYYNIYLFMGMLFTVIGSFIIMGISYIPSSGYNAMMQMYGVSSFFTLISMNFSTYYINMSIFLAYAATFPDMQVLLMFIIPIKVKWMGIAYAVLLVVEFFQYGLIGRIVIVASLLNFVVFFLLTRKSMLIRMSPKQVKRRHDYKKEVKKARPMSIAKHKCAVCGRNSEDNPEAEFRFCSKCNGNYEYCQEHLFTHTHVK
jgi:hypothetical protein